MSSGVDCSTEALRFGGSAAWLARDQERHPVRLGGRSLRLLGERAIPGTEQLVVVDQEVQLRHERQYGRQLHNTFARSTARTGARTCLRASAT